jgi:hypothetical protein
MIEPRVEALIRATCIGFRAGSNHACAGSALDGA